MLRNLGVSRGLRSETNVYKQIKSNKTNNGAKKNENEQAQICLARWFEEKKNKHETSQNKHQEKLQQGKTRSNQQSKNSKRSVRTTKTKMRSQEVAQISEATPATTCRKTRNVNVNNLPTKNN